MKKCQFVRHASDLIVCEVCGREVRTSIEITQVRAACPAPKEIRKITPRHGLGDYIKHYLTRWGITPELWLWVKHFGNPPQNVTCGCEERQKKLNHFGERAMRFFGWMKSHVLKVFNLSG